MSIITTNTHREHAIIFNVRCGCSHTHMRQPTGSRRLHSTATWEQSGHGGGAHTTRKDGTRTRKHGHSAEMARRVTKERSVGRHRGTVRVGGIMRHRLVTGLNEKSRKRHAVHSWQQPRSALHSHLSSSLLKNKDSNCQHTTNHTRKITSTQETGTSQGRWETPARAVAPHVSPERNARSTLHARQEHTPKEHIHNTCHVTFRNWVGRCGVVWGYSYHRRAPDLR